MGLCVGVVHGRNIFDTKVRVAKTTMGGGYCEKMAPPPKTAQRLKFKELLRLLNVMRVMYRQLLDQPNQSHLTTQDTHPLALIIPSARLFQFQSKLKHKKPEDTTNLGVSKGSETLAHLKKLSRADVGAIICMLYETRKSSTDLLMAQPTIDGDSNNIAFVVANKSNNVSMAVAAYYRDWAHCGLKVAPVADGDVRPTAKQATNERMAKREKARIQGHILMKECHALKRNLSTGTHSAEEASKIKGLIKDMERKSRNKLTSAETKMPAIEQ